MVFFILYVCILSPTAILSWSILILVIFLKKFAHIRNIKDGIWWILRNRKRSSLKLKAWFKSLWSRFFIISGFCLLLFILHFQFPPGKMLYFSTKCPFFITLSCLALNIVFSKTHYSLVLQWSRVDLNWTLFDSNKSDTRLLLWDKWCK